MFLDDFIEFISADTSINNMCTGGIRFDHLPTDFDADKEWIVFGFSINEIYGCAGDKNALTRFDLEIQVVSKNIVVVESLASALNEHLLTYPNGWGIDSYLLDESIDWNSEKEVYFKTLKYNVLY